MINRFRFRFKNEKQKRTTIIASIIVFTLWLFLARTNVIACKVYYGEAKKGITVTGIVKSFEIIELRPSVISNIIKIKVSEGDYVKKGQILAILENRDIQGRIKKAEGLLNATKAKLQNLETEPRKEEIEIAKAEVKEAEASIKVFESKISETEIQLKDAISIEKRFELLYNEGAISLREYEDAVFDRAELQKKVEEIKYNVNQAEAMLVSKKANLILTQNKIKKEEFEIVQGELESAAGGVEEAIGTLERYVLRSPIDGYVADLILIKGCLATSQDTILLLTNPNMLYIQTYVEEKDISQIKTGQKVLNIFDAYPNKILQTSVWRKIYNVDKTTGTFEVHIKLKPSNKPLTKLPKNINIVPGMTGDSTIIVNEYHKAVIIPSDFIFKENGKNYVFKKYGPFAVKKKIKSENFDNNKSLILKGLNKGDFVLKRENDKKLSTFSRIRVKELIKNFIGK